MMRPTLTSLSELRTHLPLDGLALLVDIDGTISAIAPTPQEATVHPACKEALQALASRLPLVAAVTGRPAAEAAAMVGVTGMVYVGNHGLERWDGGTVRPHPQVGASHAVPPQHAMDSALQQLEECLSLPGVLYEHKGLTASVHYRLTPDPAEARRAILKAAHEVTSLLPIRVREGRMVIELRPAVDADKGTAVEALLKEYPPAVALYLGDDLTDVDAFRAIHRWAELGGKWGAAVAVVSDETPSIVRDEADYALAGLEEVREFLKWLAEFYGGSPADRTGR